MANDTQNMTDVTQGNTLSYLNGRRMMGTESSVLVSSSAYLNDSRVREWVATESLRRNGPDYPLLYGMPSLLNGIGDSRDHARIEELVTAERRINPAFDAFVGEHFLSTFTLDDLAACPSGSVGMRGWKGAVDSVPATLVFGEGREIF